MIVRIDMYSRKSAFGLMLAFGAAFISGSSAQQHHPHQQVIEAARAKSPSLEGALGTIPATGTVYVWGQDYVFAISSEKPATISINHQAPVEMTQIPGSKTWYRLEKMRSGVTHAYQFLADGKPLGQRGDVGGYNADSYPQPGVPKGEVSEKRVITSKLYPGMKADYWIYTAPGYDTVNGGPLMVWQDGQGIATGDRSRIRLFTVTENLIHQKRIPPMMHLLIAPGISAENRPLRSVLYDTVTDLYGRFLTEEVIPEVEKTHKVRADGYSRAIAGESSGAVAAFTVAWFMPEKFSRVHSGIGTYTSIQWKYGNEDASKNLEGGNIYPFAIRKQPKRNIRVWLSDGMDDLENTHGSWPLQNIQMANSLKMREYDFHFRFGEAAHNGSQIALDLPESLTWLWRDYDPGKTEQTYTMEPAEKSKPYYRVKIVNREAW
jgi:enterochelin esterase family protein